MVLNDDLNREILIDRTPTRIISLVPSLSELVVDLVGINALVGVTKFCVNPPNLKDHVQIIGGTNKIDIEKIRALNPDLIIANKEENTQEQIQQLCESHKVYITDIQSFRHSLQTILTFGEIFEQREKAMSIKDRVSNNLPLNIFNGLNVLYLIWRNPWMAVGPHTYINDVLRLLGLNNVYHENERYPKLTTDEIRILNPDMIFLSSEPFPFSEKHIDEIHQSLPSTECRLVDGEAFSWYGSRLAHMDNYFHLLHSKILK